MIPIITLIQSYFCFFQGTHILMDTDSILRAKRRYLIHILRAFTVLLLHIQGMRHTQMRMLLLQLMRWRHIISCPYRWRHGSRNTWHAVVPPCTSPNTGDIRLGRIRQRTARHGVRNRIPTRMSILMLQVDWWRIQRLTHFSRWDWGSGEWSLLWIQHVVNEARITLLYESSRYLNISRWFQLRNVEAARWWARGS